MEAPSGILERKQRRRSRLRWIAIAAAIIVVLLVIIVPCAVLIPRRKHHNGIKSTVLLPLYSYPLSGVWDPLYNALNTYPNQNFTIVLNVNDGPGSSQYPPTDYTAAIQKLKTYSNVKTVGYVHTLYATRNITSVLADVATYAGWGAANATTNAATAGLTVSGIFFDEAPHDYSADALDYMSTINAAVKNAAGIASPKTVIHNPGVIPDSRLNQNNTDITVSFEQSYTEFTTQQSALSSLPLDRTRYSNMIHSVPTSASVKTTVNDMSQNAAYLFLTDLTTNYYKSFGSDWSSFVSNMP